MALLVSRLDLDLFQPIVPLKSRIISTLEDVIGKLRFETVRKQEGLKSLEKNVINWKVKRSFDLYHRSFSVHPPCLIIS